MSTKSSMEFGSRRIDTFSQLIGGAGGCSCCGSRLGSHGFAEHVSEFLPACTFVCLPKFTSQSHVPKPKGGSGRVESCCGLIKQGLSRDYLGLSFICPCDFKKGWNGPWRDRLRGVEFVLSDVEKQFWRRHTFPGGTAALRSFKHRNM